MGNVIWMDDMFIGASSFDQDLGNWQVSMVMKMANMFLEMALLKEYYDSLLDGWGGLAYL